MPTLEENLKRLDEIAQLEDNWDGYSAYAFSFEHIIKAKEFAETIEEYSPYVFPTANNSIQFETTYNGNYIEWELFSDGKVKKFVCSDE